MSQELSKNQFFNKEIELVSEYPFLNLLSADHPDLAVRIFREIPTWKAWISQNSGSEIVADAFLQAIDYVTFEEIEESIQSWVTEVTAFLNHNPKRLAVFILDAIGSGSQKYFAQRVYERLQPELQMRIKMLGGDEMLNELYSAPEDFDTFVRTDYWRFDDSANSGRQVCSLVFTEFSDMGENLRKSAVRNNKEAEYLEFIEKKEDHPKLHLRFIRITKYAEDQLRVEWERLQRIYEKTAARAISLDLQFNGVFPTTNEVTKPLDVPWEKGKTGPAYLYAQHHVTGHPVLGFFATKIQDNLPAGIVRSKLTPQGLKPLLESDDIKPPWK